jgi:acetyl esterase
MPSFNLEQSARELTEAIAAGPPLSGIPLAEARKAVEAAQPAPIPMPDIDESWATVPSAFGDVQARIVRPPGSARPLPVILYMHGGGWILGSSITHDLLTRRLAVGANAAVVFVEYSRAPEAKYPVQIEQCYAAAQWIKEQGAAGGFDATRIAVAGDSADGNMSTVLALLAKQRGSVQFVHQSLYYPMTDATAEGFRESAEVQGRALRLCGQSRVVLEQLPGRRGVANPDPGLSAAGHARRPGRPAACLVIVDENDVLQDQGEAYADKLRDAGVPTTSVRFNGTIHDFMRLNALRDSESTHAAISLAVAALRRAFGTE